MIEFSKTDELHMRIALELAAQGAGYVEPNPLVGCVIVEGDRLIGRGYHERFGQAHAEVNALRDANLLTTDATRGLTAQRTAYVTLEPCCHHGKTPPCTAALVRAGVGRVVVASLDPFPQVAGGGVQQLRDAGIVVDVGLLDDESQRLNAPYRKRLLAQRPWIIAKWAMTLDGKIASHTHHSQWISSAASRQIVHELRGRVDAVMVGRQTATTDNPRLTARPPGPRTATRIVVDSSARLSVESQLVQSASDAHAGPVIVAVSAVSDQQADNRPAHAERCARLREHGCEIVECAGSHHADRLDDLLRQLAERTMTNVLVEGGGQLLGSLMDLDEIDELHVFVAPKIIGGSAAVTPIAGRGLPNMDLAKRLAQPVYRQVDADMYIQGRLARREPDNAGHSERNPSGEADA